MPSIFERDIQLGVAKEKKKESIWVKKRLKACLLFGCEVWLIPSSKK